MRKFDYDVVVVGGGPAGLACAISASKNGAKTLIVERENKLGGILKQCIHSGFGLHYFNEELTGPEYAYRFIEKLNEEIKANNRISVWLNSFVIKVESNAVSVKNEKGVQVVTAGSIVLCMGCRERTAGAIGLTGTRPSGVWTAGQAQKWVNMYGVLPCKKPIILGSGDIGLIMARRLTLEGAKPQMVLEIMKESGGLKRNIKQCLDDFNIPLYTNTTVVEVLGYPKITGVVVAQVDDNLKPIEDTKKKIACDGLILSVGLIPETDLIKGVKFNPKTNSAMVNEYRETTLKNVFMCGNVLHVHDLVDFVTDESTLAGVYASQNALVGLNRVNEHNITAGNGVRYVLPNSYFEGTEKVKVLFRVTKRFVKTKALVKDSLGNVVASKFILSASAGGMQEIVIDKTGLKTDITLSMEEN